MRAQEPCGHSCEPLRRCNATRLGETLQAGGDIHTVAEEVSSPDHHIAHVNADPELKPPLLGLSGARLCELLLNRNGALDRIDRARKLGQHAIASGVGDPAPMLSNQPVHDLASGSEGAQSPGLVLAYQAGVPRHISGENRCQSPFNPLFLVGEAPFHPAVGASCGGWGLGSRVEIGIGNKRLP